MTKKNFYAQDEIIKINSMNFLNIIFIVKKIPYPVRREKKFTKFVLNMSN